MKEAKSLLTNGWKLHKFNQPSKHYHFIFFAFIIVLLLTVVFSRFAHLDADPPPGFIPNDSGFHIDEGYKTLAPKNLLVFGDTKWHPQDLYSGWMARSPVTQWAYFIAFKSFGLKLASARVVTAIFFVLFMAITFFLLSLRYKFPLTALCLLLLATDVSLFHFSRSALFEIAIILFSYTGIILVSRVPTDKPLQSVVTVTIFAFLSMFMVKMSAILYCAPSILACFVLYSIFSRRCAGKKNTVYLFALPAILLVVTIITKDVWSQRIHVETISLLPYRFLLNPMPDLSTLALLIGYSCILHLLLTKPEVLYKDLYRISLSATVIGAPLILSFFDYNPPRYYVPIIPACLLLAIEWVHLNAWKIPRNYSLTLVQKIAAVAVFIPFSMLLLRFIEILILRNLPYNIGQDPGLSLPSLYNLFPFFLFFVAFIFYLIRNRSIAMLGFTIPLFILLHVLVGIVTQTNSMMHLSYDSQSIRETLKNEIESSESVAGDWAPFFTAETPIRSFYMSKGVNSPSPTHIDKIRPNYFLSSGSPFDPLSLELLQSNKALELSKPIMLGVFMNQDIKLYKIEYLVR